MGRHWWNGHLAADGSRRKDRGGRGRGRRLAGGGGILPTSLTPCGQPARRTATRWGSGGRMCDGRGTEGGELGLMPLHEY